MATGKKYAPVALLKDELNKDKMKSDEFL